MKWAACFDFIEAAVHGKIFTIFEGTSEIQRLVIGRTITGLPVR